MDKPTVTQTDGELVGHTPGPWKWEVLRAPNCVVEWTLAGPDVLCRYWYEKEPSADARLIASAPALAAENASLKAELVEWKEREHYANGTCDLAIKHRDIAEQENASLKAVCAAFRAVDDQDWDYLLSLIGDGGRARFWKAVIAEARAALDRAKEAGVLS